MTDLVMAMPYRAYVDKAQREGFRIHALWDERVARGLYGPGWVEYLAEMRRRADSYATVDFTDAAGYEAALRRAVDTSGARRVYHVGGEESMLLTYRLAERMGRAVNPARSIELLNSKRAMRRLLAEHGLSPVRSAEAERWADVAGLLDSFELPVVVKPTELAGSRAVLLLRHRDQLVEWKRLLDSYAYTGPLLVEEYLRGPEFSVETLSDHGRHEVIGVTRKVLGQPPLFVEAGHVHPVPGSPAVRAMGSLAVELLTAAGYQTGPAHTEIIYTAAGPRIVETQARLGGDRIPRLVELSTGLDIERGIFQALAGRGPRAVPPRCVARISYFDLPRGRVTAVSGVEEARSLGFVDELVLPFAVGDEVPETVDWHTRHGYVIVTGDSEAHTWERVQRVRSLIRVAVAEPSRPFGDGTAGDRTAVAMGGRA